MQLLLLESLGVQASVKQKIAGYSNAVLPDAFMQTQDTCSLLAMVFTATRVTLWHAVSSNKYSCMSAQPQAQLGT